MPLCKHGDFFQRSPFFPPRPDEQATQSLCCILPTLPPQGKSNPRHEIHDYCDRRKEHTTGTRPLRLRQLLRLELCLLYTLEPDLCIRASVGKLSPLLIPVVECPSHRGVRRTASLARGPAREIGSRLASSRCVPGTLTNPFHHSVIADCPVVGQRSATGR